MMSQFTARTVKSEQDLAVGDHTASDTGTQGNDNRVAATARGPDRCFTQGSGIGIIGQLYRQIHQLRERIRDGSVVEMQIAGINNDALLRIDDPGSCLLYTSDAADD